MIFSSFFKVNFFLLIPEFSVRRGARLCKIFDCLLRVVYYGCDREFTYGYQEKDVAMTSRYALLTLFLFCTAIGQAADTVPRSAEHDAIAEVSVNWVDAFRARDIEGLLSLYTEDARVMSQGKPARIGKAEIHELFVDLLGGESLPAISYEIEEIGLMGEFAWASVLAAIGSGDSADLYLSRTFIIYRRNENGEWQILRDVDHATPDADRVPLP
jgi:uncharacterized protein (TIGR02246 family)